MGYIGTKPSAVPLTSADITDGIITSAKIADGTIVNADINASAAIDASKLTGVTSGLTEFDQWRISTDFDIPNSVTVINSGWERSDEPSYSLIGTGMTESSGVFTFPSTGYYLVTFTAQVASGNYASTNSEIHIQATIDNSSYDRIALGWVGYKGGANPISRTTSSCQAIIDVTNTANVKVRFTCTDNDNVTIGLEGTSVANHTSATFIKLGNT
jgi:hypothetical protein